MNEVEFEKMDMFWGDALGSVGTFFGLLFGCLPVKKQWNARIKRRVFINKTGWWLNQPI